MDELSDGATKVLRVLSEQPLSRWTRAQLVGRTGLGDRAVRDAVRELRRRGIAVVASSRDAGYWLARTATEVEAMEREYRSRAVDEFTTARALRATRRSMVAAGPVLPPPGRLL